MRARVSPSISRRGSALCAPAAAEAPATAELGLGRAAFGAVSCVSVGTLRMPLLTAVAVLAPLAVTAPIGLGPGAVRALRHGTGCRLQPLERLCRSHEIG